MGKTRLLGSRIMVVIGEGLLYAKERELYLNAIIKIISVSAADTLAWRKNNEDEIEKDWQQLWSDISAGKSIDRETRATELIRMLD